jgi:inhibitor of KinA sporulation pathway (predicted exonuclease)
MSEKREHMLVVDLEATCWRGHPPKGMMHEIIEIGLVVLDSGTKEILDRDSLIIKPEYSEISTFCTELTTLTPEFVDSHGIKFSEACEILKEKYRSHKRIWGSWGNYDRNQMHKDCHNKNVKYPFSDLHYNLKPLFSFAMGINRELGVSSALEYMEMPFEGTQHRGVDDAVNIGRLVEKMFNK